MLMPMKEAERERRLDCQSFPKGCCGCCVNMRWNDRRITRFLLRNTRVVHRLSPNTGRPTLGRLVRMHLACGGVWDWLLMLVLVIPTFGLSALVWRRYFASCCFAGMLDSGGRVGCLIHPMRLGEPDLRRHAFPLIPTAGCDRLLRCAMLDCATLKIDTTIESAIGDHLSVSRRGFASLSSRSKRWASIRRTSRPPTP